MTAATGISVSDVSGGGSGITVGTIVDISSVCATGLAAACNSVTTANVEVSNVYSPFSPTTQRALIDHIAGNTTSEATLGFYSLGDGATTGTTNNRPVITTSSSFGSTPNFHGMTTGSPVTSVQGTGTLVQMSTLPAVSTTNLAKFDGSGNTVDAGIAPGTIPWSGLTSATGSIILSNGSNTTTFDQTSGVSWLWANTATANSGTTNASPGLNIAANYYTGSAPAVDNWSMQSSLAAGTNGASTLTFSHTGSSGLAIVAFPGIGQTAAASFGGTCSVTGGPNTACPTITIGHAYTTPVCIVTRQGTGTVSAGMCNVSGTSVTVTGSANGNYGYLVFGNPN